MRPARAEERTRAGSPTVRPARAGGDDPGWSPSVWPDALPRGRIGNDQRHPTDGLSGGEQVLPERRVEGRRALARERREQTLQVERSVRQRRLHELRGVEVEQLDLGAVDLEA